MIYVCYATRWGSNFSILVKGEAEAQKFNFDNFFFEADPDGGLNFLSNTLEACGIITKADNIDLIELAENYYILIANIKCTGYSGMKNGDLSFMNMSSFGLLLDPEFAKKNKEIAEKIFEKTKK